MGRSRGLVNVCAGAGSSGVLHLHPVAHSNQLPITTQRVAHREPTGVRAAAGNCPGQTTRHGFFYTFTLASNRTVITKFVTCCGSAVQHACMA